MKNFVYAIALLLFCAALPGCYCWDAAHAQDQKCIAAKITVDCTKDAAIAEAPNLLPLVKWVLAGAPGGQMDWQTLLKSLLHAGFDLVGCTAEQFDNAFALKMSKMEKARSAPGASAASFDEAAYLQMKTEAAAIHNNWHTFLVKNYPNVSFKLPEKNPLESAVK